MNRVYGDKININMDNIKEFYKKRATEKITVHIDSPVVLCGDTDNKKIDEWTRFEIENRINLLEIDNDSNILELGCGTGRISKFIIDLIPKSYTGIDYVQELVDIAKNRLDIKKSENINFLSTSFKDFFKSNRNRKFNRFFISGGVLMYINDCEAKECIKKLADIMDENSVIYISEPISTEKRLTLNEFYSENLKSNYSALYRTENEYINLFKPLIKKGFSLNINEEFFYEDIKRQKETKQWLFVLKNS